MVRATKLLWLLIASCGLSACSIAPRHTSLAGAQLPELLPVRAFVANTDYNESYRISPDGRMLAWRGVSRLRPAILWRHIDGEQISAWRFKKGAPGPRWAADGHTILYHGDPSGRENHHVYAIDTREPQARPRDLTPYAGVKAFVAHVPLTPSGRVFVKHNRRDRAVFDLFSIDIDTGAETLVHENIENIINSIIDDDGAIKARVRQTKTSRLLEVPDGAAWRTLVEASKFDALHPVALSKDGQRLRVVSNVGRNRQVFAELWLESGNEEILFEHPEVDVEGVVLSPGDRRPLAAYTAPGYPEIHIFDESLKSGLAALRAHSPAGLRLSSLDRAERFATVTAYDHGGATFHLLDLHSGKQELLGVSSSHKKRQHFVEMQPFSFAASDGMRLHGYLTLPRLSKASLLPTVVLVHGGPWARDQWGYNTIVQFLANRGYAVLQVNYRGSSGYGRHYMYAAEGEFATRMHQDLLDAVDWAVAQGHSDPDSVAIMGGSYGGYATLVGMTMTPGRFVCGVDIVGVSDLAGLIESAPPYWRPYLHLWHRFVGDPAVPAQRKKMDAKSPLYFADRVQGQLLILHGVNDPRVALDQSDRMVAALRAAGKDVEYITIGNEGHGFGHWKNQLRLYREVEDFLAGCIGGRSSGFDYYQLGSWAF